MKRVFDICLGCLTALVFCAGVAGGDGRPLDVQRASLVLV